MDPALADAYTSPRQKVRVITESWVEHNMFCPRCGCAQIKRFVNNKPVADFYCPQCNNQFELKSKNRSTLDKVLAGAYATMIERITGMNNPDFFFMLYSKSDWTVKNFFFVPKHFFTPSIIEKRPPLPPTARRAGWTGSIILLNKIPETGIIPIIKDGIIMDNDAVMKKIKKADSLKTGNIETRGWLLDILTCVERMPNEMFKLSEMYGFEEELSLKHPDNHHVRDKIREQLQVLRDRGIIEFVSRGEYRKLN